MKRGTGVKMVRKVFAGLLACGACAAACAGTVRTVTAPALTLDTRIGLVKVVEDAATLRLSTRWDGVPEGVLTVNGAEAARLGAAEETDHVLDGLAPGEYVCQWTTGASKNLATFCVRGGASALPPDGAGVRTATAAAIALDTRIGLVKEVEDAAPLRLSTRWDGTKVGVLTVNGAEAARLGADEEADHVLDGLAPGEYVCQWTTGASTNLATFCVRGGASALPPDGAGVRTATAVPVVLDTRIGLVKVVEDAAMLRLSTRWDGAEAGVLTVNGEEVRTLGAVEEADHVLDGLAPGEYVCQWTTDASTNLATFCVRGSASTLPPDGVGVRTATAAPVVLDTRIGLLKVVEDAATLRLSTRWDGVPEGVLTVNGAAAARLGADAEADHVLDGLAPGEYVCQWTTGASTNLATFCVRGGASVLPPGGAGVRTATAAPVALDTRIGLVKVVEDAATLRLSTRWDGVPEGVLTVNGAEAARLGAAEEADHTLDGLAPGEYVCQWTTDASTNLATFCVRGGASILPPDGAGVRTVTAAPVALDTRIGLYKVLPVSDRGVASAVCRLSTRWDGAESGTLTVNGEEVRALGVAEEADHRLDSLAPGEYVCRWTAGDATYLATFSVRGDGSTRPPRTGVEVTITGHTATYPYDGREKRAGGFDVAISDPFYTADDFVFTGNSNAVRTAVGTTAFGMSASDFANVNPDFADVVFHVVDGSVTVTPGAVVNPFDPDDPSAPMAPDALARADCVAVYDGEGHTISVAPLLNPALAADGAAVTYSPDPSRVPFAPENPVFTNAVSTCVWYRVASPNYAPFTTNALLEIRPRTVTLTSGTKLDFVYDGQPHAFPHFIKSGHDFVAGEGIVASNWATVTRVDEGEVANTFDYVAQEGTDLANYEIAVVTGRIAVVAASIPVGPSGAITAVGYTNVYDGAAHGVVVSASGLLTPPTVQYRAREADAWSDASPVFRDVCDTQVWYRVSAPNYAPVVGSVGIRITPRPVTLTSKSATKVYDGMPLTAHEVVVGGDGFADGEGAAYAFTGEQTAVGTSENTFTYALNGNMKADNYAITMVNGTLTVTKVSIGGGEGDGGEPGDGEVPEGGLSKFDVAFVYDGAGHTIDTNALVVAFGAAMIGENTVEYAAGGSQSPATVPGAMNCVPPCFTNAGEYVVWYKVTNPNYEDFVHRAKVTITKRPVTLTSGTKLDFVYDGQPHACPHFIKSGHDFVEGEGIVASNWATVTRVDEGEVANTFTYATQEGTDLANYAITVVTGKIAVVKATYDMTNVAWNYAGPFTYDGTTKCVELAGLPEGVSAVYTDNEKSAAGTYVAKATFAYDAVNHHAPAVADCVWEIAKAPVGPGGGVEPGDGEVPEGGLSRFDMVAMYDGTGHTVDTNGLVAAFSVVMGGGETWVDYGYAAAGAATGVEQVDTWSGEPPVYTNAGEYVVWYKVTNPNYEDFVHRAKVTITKRPVTLTSGTNLDFVYDGQPHAFPHFIKSGHDFVAGEGIETFNWATVTRVDEGEVANTFDYTAQEGTDLANYEIAVVTGRIAVVSAPIPVGPDGAIAAVGYTNVYDGAAHGVAVSAAGLLMTPTVQYRAREADAWADASPVFRDVCDTQVWYRVSAPNYAPVVGSVGVRITPRPVTLASKSATKVYDGMPLTAHEVTVGGDGFADGEGAAYAFTGSQTVVGTSENAFSYTLNEKTAAGNYDITVENGSLTVTKASIGGGDGGGGEPGSGEIPGDGLSKFDTTAMYDGAGHTVDTNALVETFAGALVDAGEAKVYYGYAATGAATGVVQVDTWSEVPPVYTNAGEYVVWYRVTNPNYEDFTHRVRVTITRRRVTVTSADGTWAYDGTAHSNATVTVSGDGFVPGEGVACGGFATITDEGARPNSFTHRLHVGTLAGNYEITAVFGTLTVTAAPPCRVVLDALGGRIGSAVAVTQAVRTIYGALPEATRGGYRFAGWFLGVTNGAPEAVAGGDVLAPGDHALFAKWICDPEAVPDPEAVYTWEALDANAARITGLRDPKQRLSRMVLPDRIGGRFVTEVAAGAFANTACGVEELWLPVFCTKIGDRAFLGIPSLRAITFAEARRWEDPPVHAAVSIGRYAFSGATSLARLVLVKEIASLGDYAFLNARNLTSVTILGRPTLGRQVFRSCGVDAGGVTVRLDPALADDAAYREALTSRMADAKIRTDAIVAGLRITVFELLETGMARLVVSVERAADWGVVNADTLLVRSGRTLPEMGDAARPLSAVRNGDGTVTLEVAAPDGGGFFQAVITDE